MYGQYPHPASYVMVAPQPYQYPYGGKSGSSLGTFCRCLCCIFCFLWMLFLLSLLLVYMLYKPKMPIYKLDHLAVKRFSMDTATTATATELQLTVRAQNTNAKVSFSYGSDSWVSVSYMDQEICSGKLPEFRQGYHNVTEVEINLSGTASLGVVAAERLKESQKKGEIQLVAKVNAPISASFGDFRVGMFVFHVCIHITVDSLSPDKNPKVLSTNYQFFFHH